MVSFCLDKYPEVELLDLVAHFEILEDPPYFT